MGHDTLHYQPRHIAQTYDKQCQQPNQDKLRGHQLCDGQPHHGHLRYQPLPDCQGQGRVKSEDIHGHHNHDPHDRSCDQDDEGIRYAQE